MDLPHLIAALKLPVVESQALLALQDTSSSAREVESILLDSPSLSSKMLRAAKSSFFDSPTSVTTVADALFHLGFRQVQSLVLAIALRDRFPTRHLDVKPFWRHLIATATGAHFLALRAHCSPEETFQAGLLHDVGKLVLIFVSEGAYMDALRLQHGAALSSQQAEEQTFGCSHTTAGSAIAESWLLPKEDVQVIRHHHDPLQADGAWQSLCGVVCIANLAAHEAFASLFAHEWNPSELERIWDAANLSPDAMDQCVTYIQESEEEIQSLMTAME